MANPGDDSKPPLNLDKVMVLVTVNLAVEIGPYPTVEQVGYLLKDAREQAESRVRQRLMNNNGQANDISVLGTSITRIVATDSSKVGTRS